MAARNFVYRVKLDWNSFFYSKSFDMTNAPPLSDLVDDQHKHIHVNTFSPFITTNKTVHNRIIQTGVGRKIFNYINHVNTYASKQTEKATVNKVH